MAEIDEELMTAEAKKDIAQDLFNRGSRNYLVRDYAEACEDFSQCCELYSQLYAEDADELGLPYLYYAKSLIALAQGGENKVLTIDEEQGGQSDDDDDDSGVDEEAENGTKEENASDKAPAELDAGKKTESVNADEPQPGTSSGKTNGTDGKSQNGSAPEGEEEEEATNLQYAWEALEIAVKIFERKGEEGLSNLADACFQLGEISMENSQSEEAIKDYSRSVDIRVKLEEDNLRLISETKYKIGLCYMVIDKWDESIAAFKDSAECLEAEIANIRSKEPSADTEAQIKDIEETKQEILNKIVDIEEAKSQSIDEVKREIAKLMNPIPEAGASTSSNGAGSSSASNGKPSESEKPRDISHLIKRKKPETTVDAVDGAPSAKKPALE